MKVPLPVYKGKFGPRQAERLLWRAGFGPRRGEVERLVKAGVKKSVTALTKPPAETLQGPAPRDDEGRPLAPRDAWGHDHLWWLDRMVRSNQPLVERMTLNWHDWFATADVASSRLTLDQNELLRSDALGRFDDLLTGITADPAMLLWLSGNRNTKSAPNENYAREMMELFTLGAGVGYTEHDVREQARALTGWRNDWNDGGPTNFRFDPGRHDSGVKTIFGRSGNFDWRAACQLCLDHPSHPDFLVTKLWSYFVPTPPSDETLQGLKTLYAERGHVVKPLVQAILLHPDFYQGPRMVKPPVVYIAGMLRALGRGVDIDDWSWIGHLSGQQLFHPPNVAGWDESRWVDTATWRGRWYAAVYAVKPRALDPEGKYKAGSEGADEAVDKALNFWGTPSITPETRRSLVKFAKKCERRANEPWKKRQYRVMRQNALRLLIATSPDFQTA